jgi:hypothetical protein
VSDRNSEPPLVACSSPVASDTDATTNHHSPLTSHSSHRWLAAAIIVGLAVRLHCLFFPCLWLDEYVTLWSIGGGSYAEMLDRALRWTASGPLFVLSYRLSCDLVGDVEWGLKLPGVLCGTASVWAAWWTAWRLFQRADVAMAAAWLVAIAPQCVHFSQEGRPYMPAALLLLLALGSLCGWLRTGNHGALAATGILSLAAVGFHLLAVLALVAQNVAVIGWGLTRGWPKRRWIAWLAAQAAVACGLWFSAVQFRRLSGRQDSLVFHTELAEMSRDLLGQELRREAQSLGMVVLTGLAIWWCARKLPHTAVARAWSEHREAVCTAVGSYVLPSVLLIVLSASRKLDCWPRYYFLFQPGLLLAWAWLLACPVSRGLSRCLAAGVGLAMLCQYNLVGGVPSCRLNVTGSDWSLAQADLRRRVGPDDLIISRCGLIEANQLSFLCDPVGSGYLKCFLEASDGPLAAEHVPLPFTPETEATRRYVESVARDQLSQREEFWLVNVGTADFDYRDWIRARFGERFRLAEEFNYSALVVCHYLREGAGNRVASAHDSEVRP